MQFILHSLFETTLIVSIDPQLQFYSNLFQLFLLLKCYSMLEGMFLRSHQSWALQLDYSKSLQV